MNEPLLTQRRCSRIVDLIHAVESDMMISSKTNITTRKLEPQHQSGVSDSAQEPVEKQRVYKKRKPTHTVRKEEKVALQAEIAALQIKLKNLELQVLVQRGEEDIELNSKVAQNMVLRDLVQEQHLVVAHAQGMLRGCAQRHSHQARPTETFIHLIADRKERLETLKAVRGTKLHYARRFIQYRSIGLHPTAEYFHEERYETPAGDYCNVRFDRVPLRGVKGGIRAVLDALKYAAFNAEIIISETSGDLTIREDDDVTEEECSQRRLVTRTTRGFLVENNLVHFTDFSHAEEGSYAVTTADFVDEDELYPYRPRDRIRRDTTAAILVTSHVDPEKKKQSDADAYGGHTSSEEEVYPVIVITCWAFTRICHTELNVPHEILREMRDLSGRVSQTMLNCVRESVGLSKQS
ncbi:hypothetical protein PC116_g4762 [Phytophthora cactorum]|uniref:Uncharacterized protein n=1 Tax=Phytophthora cactorum TaxID=29920 RepID=A0A329RQ64_9STRA|nr:hypothetical protein Pcac1_g17723 [Phytophthora cactorum]KAG2826984.1 hypothetical protein PC112_g9042 [Phytophthora cactorum]KAG2828971.1 hypothetical protein PC111_g7943 [Phytophthora cactorum]KAG2858872.1 hypothetical protein PC113_g9439 [Phytophthora cactorum]KAG2908031.1 hypothetical protein PC114_g10626 [Phytophthora cactorum]